ncbi:hypothetical protein RclHR1_05860008 [Rhizophagus clarus]|uniref:Uncharacterized protein n=1 Tax=Rhizophagus clarus TaxID=94130 RepID=A0A2Z6S6G0_9GLOM|nr:hypothetical protein RclHR1_05860008 [Rhizophagus clarus]
MIENRIKYNTTNSQEASVRNESFKRYSDTSIRMGNVFKIIETNSIFQCQIQEKPPVIKAKLIAIIMTLLCLDRMKAHDSDDHSNIVDKLAKETYSKECLVIDPKLLVYNGSIYWNHKPIERNITLMVKDIKETQYIEQFLTLNRNRYFILLSDLESFDWSLTFRYIKDKFDDTFAFDSRFNFFKIKLHAKELPTQDNLCK